MTQDEIIEMAKQAGMDYLQYISPEAFEKVEAFAKLVAQHEREACAKLAEQVGQHKNQHGIASAIRARL
jgi:tRNA(Leu) C34 or U34 (ribose-2'-O)-methylase TrmL